MNRVLVFLLLSLCGQTSHAATILKGAIYNDTTLTKANSPYIITDFVHIESPARLTIEAGVEIRVSKLATFQIKGSVYAIGNPADSIRFTTNEPVLQNDSWPGLKVSYNSADTAIFDYCVFEYATTGLDAFNVSQLSITHSRFANSKTGMRAVLVNAIIKHNTIENCLNGIDGAFVTGNPLWGSEISHNVISNISGIGFYMATDSNRHKVNNNRIEYCREGLVMGQVLCTELAKNIFQHNKYGVTVMANTLKAKSKTPLANNVFAYNDTAIYGAALKGEVSANTIKYNKFGIYITTGDTSATYLNNCFEGNTSHVNNLSSIDIDFKNNYWTATDSLAIQPKIIALGNGKVFFVPFLTQPDSSCKSVDPPTNVENKTAIASSVTACPNPFTSSFTIKINSTQAVKEVSVYNMMGTLVATPPVSDKKSFSIDMEKYPAGLYLYKVVFTNSEVYSGKLMKR